MRDLSVAELATRAEGNPFYLEETINLLRDRGIELADADEVVGAAIPDTLAGVVMARIDRLGEREKTTLKVASVIGRRFRDAWVWGSSPELGGKAAVGDSLDDLTRGDVAGALGSNAAAVVFVAVMGVAWVVWVVRRSRGQDVPWIRLSRPWFIVVATAMLAFAILRWTPWGQGLQP